MQWANVLMAALMLAQAAPKEGKIDTVQDKSANFAAFKSYSWAKGQEAYNPSVHKIIVEAIDAEMSARGFTKVEGGAADVTIRYHTILSTKVDLDKLEELPKADQPAPASATVDVGRLVIAMRTVQGDKQVWAASTTDSITRDPASRDQAIRGVVGRLFETYPKTTPQ